MTSSSEKKDSELRFVSSAIIPYEDDNYVLVQTEKDGLWGLPGGKIDLFEDPQRATIREIREETGLDILLDSIVGIYPFETHRAAGDDRTSNYALAVIYHAHIVDGELGSSKDGVKRVEAVSFGEIRNLYHSGQLRSLVNLKSVEDYLTGQKANLDFVSYVLRG